MSRTVIEISNLGKRYRIGAQKESYLSLRDEIARCFSPSARRARSARTELWALRDVSFDVEDGEAVGIIGRNGAGKSTLLKILSRITPPTEGKVTMRGRVASLLEVGTGFHPELTGRENVYLNGAILGMTRGEIARKFDEIVAFAEVEKFLDTPVKRYSSGMFVRLAFAVAAHLEPEILLVDEVLSVGDSEFQTKCLGKMSEAARSGRTVIFVSHNMAAVSRLCEKGVVLDGGRIAHLGTAESALKHYMDAIRRSEERPESGLDEMTGHGNGARFLRVRAVGSNGSPADTFFIGDRVQFAMDVLFEKPVRSAHLGFIIRSARSGNIYHCVTTDARLEATDLFGKVTFRATFPSLSLYPGQYVLAELSLCTPSEALGYIPDALCFEVAEGGPRVSRRLAGHAAVVHEVPEWELIRHS